MHCISLIIFARVIRRFIVLPALLMVSFCAFAQKDVIVKNDGATIRCSITDTVGKHYHFAAINQTNKVFKDRIAKRLVAAVEYNKYDSNIIAHQFFEKKQLDTATLEQPPNPYQYTASVGVNIGNILEFNSSSGPDKKSFSATCALDFALNYFKEGNRFAMTNELHYTIAVQKSGFSNNAHIQRATDDLVTLHDFSYALNKSNKWSTNLIVKTNTSLFTIFAGDYFKDYDNNGKTQGFLNPYETTLSPGIKFQPNNYFRFSLSPYSINFYGLTNQQIANTGFYTQTVNGNGDYDLFVFKQLGAELNIWYDRKLKKWLDMQYRFSISSDYFSKIAKNGLMDALFITKIKIIKNIYLTHRAIIRSDLAQKPFKPYYNQTTLLSFAKNF